MAADDASMQPQQKSSLPFKHMAADDTSMQQQSESNGDQDNGASEMLQISLGKRLKNRASSGDVGMASQYDEMSSDSNKRQKNDAVVNDSKHTPE